MFRSVVIYAFFITFMTGVVGCSTGDSFVDASDFTQRTRNTAPTKAVKLEPGDSIEISVEVDGRMEVPPHRASINYKGVATLPILGDVKVGGLKIDIARAVITKRYGSLFVSKPVVTMDLVNDDGVAEWGQVRVMGRVNSPGTIPLTASTGINLSTAIQEAGGFATSAKTTEIKVTRTTGSGKKLSVLVNFNEIGEKGNAEADIKLLDGDIVFIPERIF